MIIIKPVGGLANQMAVYAAGRALSKQCGAPLKLDLSGLAIDSLRHYELDKLNIQAEIATEDEVRKVSGQSRYRVINRLQKSIRKRLGHVNSRIYKETSLAYDPRFFKLRAPVYIVGNFPSRHYFEPIADLLQEEFAISLPLSAESTNWLEKIKKTCSVAVHIRRGDYVSNPKTTAYHGILGTHYYDSAFKAVLRQFPNAEFFIFSDDPQWVRENINVPGPAHYVDCNDPDNGYQDYWLMRHCKHHIIANSGFSRWPALLCDHPEQLVIRPARWTADSVLKDEDIGPPSWVLMDN